MDFNFKIRLLGFYHFPNQDMKPETEYVEEAKELARLLNVSIGSLMKNPDTDKELKVIIKDGAVFIFKDEKNNLYGFFTKNRTARITNVKFSKESIIQVPLKYKAWFYPGRPVRLIIQQDSNNNTDNSTTTQMNNSQNTMGSKTKIPAPEVNSKAYERVFDKMYITNVEKRLRELNSPSDNDRKRWVWELIQNAKDTIAKDPNRSTIDIRIEVDGDIVRFRHNGAPFTPDARLGLLYKYSEDKENQESTGRFGTGFLTTHCLSKVVNIESNMYSDAERKKLCGFSVTMYRDGLIASELIEGLQKMRESEVFYSETFEWTTFTYHVSSESGRQAIKLGIENFRENIAQTMLFCKELSSIVLNDNGKETTIVRKPTVYLMDDIKLSEFVISGETSLSRRFIHTSYSEHSEDLSKRYRATRNMRIDAAVEVDSEDNLVNIEDKTTFFCVMPLVGIETQLNEPLIVNSPDFEPDQERQSLLLAGITWNEEKDVITETGINQSIYEHILPMYEKIVNYLTNKHYGKLYYLANGLDRTKSHEKLDREWYKQNVINKYREILMKYPVADAQDGSGYKKLEECIIVKEAVPENEDKLYGLLQSLYPSKLVKDNHEWSDYLWKDGLSVWNTETLCGEIEQQVNWDKIALVNTNLDVWYNEFLKHVSKYNELFLKEHALLPNMNGDLLKNDTEDFKQGEHINSFVIGLLGKLGKDVKPNLLHGDITAVSLGSKYNSQSYSADINKLAKQVIDDPQTPLKVSKLLPILSVVPNDTEKYSQEFLNQRKEFFEICKALYELKDATSVCDNNLLEGAWKETDEWFVTNVLSSLKTLGSIEKLPAGLDAKWLNAALKSLQVKTEKLNTYPVLPNQNGKFCCQKDLYEDSGVPQELKDSIFDSVGISYKAILLHKDIDAAGFAVVQKKTISNFASELKGKFARQASSYYGNSFRGSYHLFPQVTLDKIALYMLSLMPSGQSSDLYKYQQSLYAISKKLLSAQTYSEQTVNYDSVDLWQVPNEYAVSQICERIEELGTIEATITALENADETSAIGVLNELYGFLSYQNIPYGTACIFPNQNGRYRINGELKREEGDIGERIKNIIGELVPSEQEFREILIDKRCIIQPQATLSAKDAFSLIDDKVYENYKNPTMWENENYIDAVHQLIEIWKDESDGQFNESNFPKSKPLEDSIVLNVVWKKERRQLLMDVSSKLTEDQLKLIVENSEQIGELSSKVKKLEDENEILRSQLAAMGMLPESNQVDEDAEDYNVDNRSDIIVPVEVDTVTEDGEHRTITVAEPQYAGLSAEEMYAYLLQAKTDVKLYLEARGYRFEKGICEDAWCNIYGVFNPEGKEVPIVVHSYKSRRRAFSLNASDWEQLSKEGSMLWVVTHDGPQCVPFYALPRDTNTIAITFSPENMQYKNRCIALAETLRYFKGLHFNFGTAITQNKSPEPFNNPKKELELSLKSTMLDMYDLPAQDAPATLTTDSQESLL